MYVTMKRNQCKQLFYQRGTFIKQILMLARIVVPVTLYHFLQMYEI